MARILADPIEQQRSTEVADCLGVDPSAAPPDTIASAFAGLSATQRESLVAQFPDIIGSLDGAPFQDRYAASAILIDKAAGEMDTYVEEVRADLDSHPNNPLLEKVISKMESKLATLRSFDDADRRFLFFDAWGDGRIAEVHGAKLEDAAHIAVVIPGMANNMWDFDNGLSQNANLLQIAADPFASGEVATIGWLGYDSPDGADVLLEDAALEGAVHLRHFVDGVRAHRKDVHITGVAHSYGGVVQGRALQAGLDIDDAVFIGVPGTGRGVEEVSDLGGRAQAWAGKTPFFSRPDGWRDALNPMDEIEFVPTGPHGADPTDKSFGATRFKTGDAQGHSQYFTGTEAVQNIGAIVANQAHLVTRY